MAECYVEGGNLASMPAESFSYTIYVRATPERIWQALTDPSSASQFWGVTHITDWMAGSSMTWQVAGVTIADPEQVVLEADAPHRLSFTWHTITDEFVLAVGDDDDLGASMAAEERSTATFDIEPFGAQSKLTVAHTGFTSGSAILAGVTDGWPMVLSSLKSLLETGEALAFS
jgi:uncharacterized protein YndB with AHSA1/START domain